MLTCPQAHLTDEQLEADVTTFAERCLTVNKAALLRAARVAKDIKLYDEVARNPSHEAGKLLVDLTDVEKRALCRERDGPFSEKGMWTIIITVSLAAFLQGKSMPLINTLYFEKHHQY